MQGFSVRRLRLAGFIVGRGGTRSSFGEQRFQGPDDGGEDDGPDGGLPFVLDCGNEHPNGEGQKQDGGQGVERHTEGTFGFGLAVAQDEYAGHGCAHDHSGGHANEHEDVVGIAMRAGGANKGDGANRLQSERIQGCITRGGSGQQGGKLAVLGHGGEDA